MLASGREVAVAWPLLWIVTVVRGARLRPACPASPTARADVCPRVCRWVGGLGALRVGTLLVDHLRVSLR